MFRRGGFRRHEPSNNLPKPVEVGKEYEVEISEVGSKGDGIARVNNFVIFLPNAKKGEKPKVKITSIGRSFAVAERVDGSSAAASTEDAASEEAVEEASEASSEGENLKSEEASEEESAESAEESAEETTE